MTQPRQIEPERTHLVTRRALRRHYLLRPEYFINNLFVFFWAVLAAKYKIEIHAFSIPTVGAALALKIQHKSIVIRLSVLCPEGARHISPGQRPGCGIIRSLALKGRNISLRIQFLLTPIAKSLSLLCRTYSARIFFSLTQGVAGGRLCPGLICVAPSGC
jgi:hypothetical protein